MHISIGGFPEQVTEAEIREALERFGAKVKSVTLEPGSGDHTLALVDVETDEPGAKALAERINGYIWKGKRLRSRVFLFQGD